MGNRKKALIICTIASSALMVSFFYAFTTAMHPVGRDGAHYLNAASRIYKDGSFYVEDIWNFFGNFSTVKKFSFTYWLPGVSLFQYLGYTFWGHSLSGALMPSFIISIVCYFLSTYLFYNYTGEKYSSILWSISVPHLFILPGPGSHLQTNVYILGIGIISILIKLNYEKLDNSHIYLSLLVSIASLVRNDWFLVLIPIVFIDIYNYIAYNTKNNRALYYIIMPILTSILWKEIYSASKLKVILFVEYQDLFKLYLEDINIYRFISQGISEIAYERFLSFYSILTNKYVLFTTLTYSITSFLLTKKRFSKKCSVKHVFHPSFEHKYRFIKLLIICLSFLVSTLLLYGILVPHFDAWGRTIKILVAFLMASTFFNISLFTKKVKIYTLIAAVLLSSLLYVRHYAHDGYYNYGKDTHRKYEKMCSQIHQNTTENDPVVLTVNVQSLKYSCKDIRAVMIPTDGVDALQDISERTGVDMIITEKGWIDKRAYISGVLGNVSPIVERQNYKMYNAKDVMDLPY